jgi:hypothetical protein
MPATSRTCRTPASPRTRRGSVPGRGDVAGRVLAAVAVAHAGDLAIGLANVRHLTLNRWGRHWRCGCDWYGHRGSDAARGLRIGHTLKIFANDHHWAHKGNRLTLTWWRCHWRYGRRHGWSDNARNLRGSHAPTIGQVFIKEILQGSISNWRHACARMARSWIQPTFSPTVPNR